LISQAEERYFSDRIVFQSWQCPQIDLIKGIYENRGIGRTEEIFSCQSKFFITECKGNFSTGGDKELFDEENPLV